MMIVVRPEDPSFPTWKERLPHTLASAKILHPGMDIWVVLACTAEDPHREWADQLQQAVPGARVEHYTALMARLTGSAAVATAGTAAGVSSLVSLQVRV